MSKLIFNTPNVTLYKNYSRRVHKFLIPEMILYDEKYGKLWGDSGQKSE